MQLARTDMRRSTLLAWCAGVLVPAGTYAFTTLSAIAGIDCERSLDPQRFCAWWEHSEAPTLIGMPAVLAFGCYATLTAGRRGPVVIAGVLVMLTCLGLREAAAPEL